MYVIYVGVNSTVNLTRGKVFVKLKLGIPNGFQISPGLMISKKKMFFDVA